MRAPVRVVVALAAVVGLAGCTGSGPEPEPGPTPSPGPDGGRVGLVAFDSCENARQELVRAATPHVGPYGLVVPTARTAGSPSVSAREDSAAGGAAAPAPATPEHSTTTVHEAGVDEPDVVKTDGRRLVSVVDGRLRVVDLASRAVTTVAGLPSGPSTQLLLHGDRALVVVGQVAVRRAGATAGGARFVLVDLAAGRVLETLTVPGSFVDGRQVGGVARLVVRSGPEIDFVRPGGGRSPDDARGENRAILARSDIDDWLPRYQLDRGGVRQEGRLVDCDRVSRPAAYSGASMLTVLTVDIAGRLGTGDPVGIVADGDTVYGTATSLYVAAQARPVPVDGPIGTPFDGPIPAPSRWQPGRTEVHSFELPAGARPRYAASGSVPGWLLNQYSLSEHDGRLRVATTVDRGDGADSCCDGPPRTESGITVLARQGDRLVPVGTLTGLGKGERIYAVRFLGPVGYVVTFRQTDPLYTVDLSDPGKPRLVGELKIPGYSAYLHPTGATTLLGVGQDATDQGRRLGTQVSLFDVGDPARPRRTAAYQVTDGHSEVEFDPHAFLWWPSARIAVVPVTAWRGGPGGAGALVLRAGDGRLEEVGTVRHPRDGVIRRSLVVGDTLWTVSDAGARAVAVADLADRGWVPFS